MGDKHENLLFFLPCSFLSFIHLKWVKLFVKPVDGQTSWTDRPPKRPFNKSPRSFHQLRSFFSDVPVRNTQKPFQKSITSQYRQVESVATEDVPTIFRDSNYSTIRYPPNKTTPLFASASSNL